MAGECTINDSPISFFIERKSDIFPQNTLPYNIGSMGVFPRSDAGGVPSVRCLIARL
jgi:hypothetical protein